jgi:translation elongation factor EF-1alpha
VQNDTQAATYVDGVKIIPNSADFLAKKKTIVDKLVSDTTAKPNINLVVVGHVDSGKSTLIGHLLVKTGRVTDKQLRAVQKESQQIGKGSFAFAWLLDEQAEERTRGITVDVGQNHFETASRAVTILDCPGHKDFVPNMLSGAAQADAGVLVVSAQRGEFESGFHGGQSREHAVLLHAMGVTQLIVAVNKMDNTTPAYDRGRYEEIRALVTAALLEIGFLEENIRFCPLSGFTGDNLAPAPGADSAVTAVPPAFAEWLDAPPLLTLLDGLAEPPRAVDKPLRMVVSDAGPTALFKQSVSGFIDQGAVVAKERLLLMPGHIPVQVSGLSVRGVPVTAAGSGASVCVAVSGALPEQLRAGLVLCSPVAPPRPAVLVRARLLCTVAAGAPPLLPGVSLLLHAQSNAHAAHIERIESLLDAKGDRVKGAGRRVPAGASASVLLRVPGGACVEPVGACMAMARVTLRREGATVAVGVVTEVLE